MIAIIPAHGAIMAPAMVAITIMAAITDVALIRAGAGRHVGARQRAGG
jgi:hypothetical protein